jgi:hypothetical protein
MQFTSHLIAAFATASSLAQALPTSSSFDLMERDGAVTGTCATTNDVVYYAYRCFIDVPYNNGNGCDSIFNALSVYTVTGWSCQPDGDQDHTYLGFNTPTFFVSREDVVATLNSEFGTQGIHDITPVY